MNLGQLAEILVSRVKEYSRQDVLKSIKRNNHMNNYDGKDMPNKETINAILVDFVNFACLPLDLALYTKDLDTEKPTLNQPAHAEKE